MGGDRREAKQRREYVISLMEALPQLLLLFLDLLPITESFLLLMLSNALVSTVGKEFNHIMKCHRFLVKSAKPNK